MMVVDFLPEAIGLGLLVSLLFTELFGLAAGGMVVPGYIALYMVDPLSVVATGQLNLATSQLVLKGVVISTHIDLFGMVIPIDIPLDTITVQL